MKESTKIQDLFLVYVEDKMLEQTEHILVQLYQPFLGTEAIGLYQTLRYVRFEQQSCSYHKLMYYMKCEWEKLQQLFPRLEAANLLTTYEGQLDGYDIHLYQVNEPLTHYQFFKDPMLVGLLTSYVGEIEVATMRQLEADRMYTIEKVAQMKNISAKAKVVFKSELLFQQTQPARPIESRPQINHGGGDYVFETFYVLLPAMIKTHYTFSEYTKKVLSQLAHIYQLTSEQMVLIFQKAYQQSRGAVVDEDTLRQLAYEFVIHHLRSDPTHAAIGQEALRDTQQNLEQLDLVREHPQMNQALMQMKQTSTLDYIQMLTKSITPQDLKNIEKLIVDYELKEEVVNVLINYTFSETGNLPAPFMEAIAQNWRKQQITQAEDAYFALKNFAQKTKQRQEEKQQNRSARRTENISTFGQQVHDIDEQEVQKIWDELGGK